MKKKWNLIFLITFLVCFIVFIFVGLSLAISVGLGRSVLYEEYTPLSANRYRIRVRVVDYGGSSAECKFEINFIVGGIYRFGCGGEKLFVDFVDKKGVLGLLPKWSEIELPKKTNIGSLISKSEEFEAPIVLNNKIYWYREIVGDLP